MFFGGGRAFTKENQTMNSNLYQTITARLLEQLAAGTVPWRKTWTTGLPKSLITRREYRGVNVLVLGLSGYTSRYWVTYREALRLGGHVRRGERASPVIYWKWRTAEERERRAQETGKASIAPCYPFTSAVFNLDQVEGVARPDDDLPAQPQQRLELADQLFQMMPDRPEILHTADGEPGYSPTCDRVTLPHLSQFETAPEYYAALFHELVHSTGHPRRLNRFALTQGDRVERYSAEELVAEFGAAFLCGFAGISNQTTDALQASYIEGWTRALKGDPQQLVRAASAAQRAADYIRGKVASEPDSA
jgi:antirestriction protein ArdC